MSEKTPIYIYVYAFRNLGINWISFLSGFYSKDAIIEFAYLRNSTLGNYAVTIGILTAFFTSIYSWRLFSKLFMDLIIIKKFQ